jgi:hypothetical protein
MRVRGAHASIKPGVQRAKRANPRIAVKKKGFQPAERATDLECGGELEATRPPWIDPRPTGCYPLRGFFLVCRSRSRGPQAPGKGQKHLS